MVSLATEDGMDVVVGPPARPQPGLDVRSLNGRETALGPARIAPGRDDADRTATAESPATVLIEHVHEVVEDLSMDVLPELGYLASVERPARCSTKALLKVLVGEVIELTCGLADGVLAPSPLQGID